MYSSLYLSLFYLASILLQSHKTTGLPLETDHLASELETLALSQNASLAARQAPVEATLDCIGKDIEEFCNFDCYAILCLGKPRVLTKNSKVNKHNYQMSGAKSECFAGSPKNVQGWNVERYNDAYVSSDEYPFEGVSEGGTGDPNNNYTPQTQWAVIMGNTHDGQSRQGNALSEMYRVSDISDGTQFRLNFHSNARYCIALASNDDSVCRGPPRDGEADPKRYAFIRTSGFRKTIAFALARTFLGSPK